MKKYKKISALVLICALLLGCSIYDDKITNVSMFLYEVEKDGKTVYVLGTNHQGEDMDKLDETTERIFDESDRIVFETDIGQLGSVNNSEYLTKNSIKDTLNQTQIDKLETVMNDYGRTLSDDVREYNLMGITSMCQTLILSATKYSSQYGVDYYLYNKAKAQSKEMDWIESVEMQLNIFPQLSIETPNFIIENLDFKTNKEYALQLFEAYYSNDIEMWNSFLEQHNINNDNVNNVEEAKIYSEIMIISRNIGMADYIENAFAYDGTTLVTFGVMHFYGDDGVLKLLTDKGYTVTPVNK